MKQATWLFVLCCAACGCSTRYTYSTIVQVVPAEKPGKFYVTARVRERSESWTGYSVRELPAPLLTCEPGELVSGTKATEKGDVEVSLEARIAVAGEDKQTDCLLTVRRGGKIVATQRILLPPLAFKHSTPTYSALPIRATVRAVDSKMGIVVLGVGSKSKPPVRKGQRLLIHRGRTFVATVRVINVDTEMCAARLVEPTPKDAIVKVGDRAISE